MLQLNIDCEGPITQNDNAFELCEKFIPNGDRFFSIVSKYDDFLADVERRKGYKAGDTLKLVLPFLKAYGVTDHIMEEFAHETLLMLPGTEIMLSEINKMLPSFIISTSYKPYLEALCEATGFPLENVYCTEVSLDSYELTPQEGPHLRKIAKEITSMQMLYWPEDVKGREELPPEHKATIERLDQIFWHEISGMKIGRILEEVNPIGGKEKAKAVKESLTRTGLGIEDVAYAGDSITDVQALELVDKGGGIAISFNGNRYAIKAARWAVLSPNTLVVAGLCKLFIEKGKDILERLPLDEAGRIDKEALGQEIKALGISTDISSGLHELLNRDEFCIYKVSASEEKDLIDRSEKMRKSVRGHGIGDLG